MKLNRYKFEIEYLDDFLTIWILDTQTNEHQEAFRVTYEPMKEPGFMKSTFKVRFRDTLMKVLNKLAYMEAKAGMDTKHEGEAREAVEKILNEVGARARELRV